VPLSSLPRDVDHSTLAALLSLVTAYLNEPEAVDAWLAAVPPPAAGAVTWIEELAADWPTVDQLSLRYAHAVVERHQGDVVRAARVLDVDRRTLSRILAEARKGRVHNLHTRA
jgi:ActR/RegA family two-component response regulator